MVVEDIIFEDIIIIKKEPFRDQRGYFERIYCCKEFENMGIHTRFVQQNISFNERIGTTRGLHYQEGIYAETKLIQCIKGCVYDVLLNLDKKSKHYGHYFATILSENNDRMIYVPQGYAHGFQTLEDNSMMLYSMGNYYNDSFAKGINCFSKDININWPINKGYIISERDKNLPEFCIG